MHACMHVCLPVLPRDMAALQALGLYPSCIIVTTTVQSPADHRFGHPEGGRR